MQEALEVELGSSVTRGMLQSVAVVTMLVVRQPVPQVGVQFPRQCHFHGAVGFHCFPDREMGVGVSLTCGHG